MNAESPAKTVTQLWRRLSPWPGGKWLFSKIMGRIVPYTGALGARVLEMSPGRARVALHDRRRVRNHLRSVHALALANVGEFASALSMMSNAPPNVRMIVTDLSIEYLKKARGDLIAEGHSQLPTRVEAEAKHIARADIRDRADDVVARVAVTWLLRPNA